MTTRAYGAYAADKPLEAIDIERRRPGPHDVRIDIAYCGVCHSDLHRSAPSGPARSIRACPATRSSAWSARSAATVTKFKVGDTVGVGCMVDSCRHCAPCARRAGAVSARTASPAPTTARPTDAPGHTLGGYSQRDRRRRGVRAEDPPSAGPARRGRAAAVRRHHHLFAAAPLEGRAGQEGRHRRHRRARPHGREARPRDGRARRSPSPPRRASARTRWTWAPTRWSSRATPRR